MLRVRVPLVALAMTVSFVGPTLAEEAVDRLRQAIESSVTQTPEFRRAAASIDVARREAAARSGGLAPFVELQREGLKSGLGDAPNATSYLRLGSTFSTPGQRRAGRDLVRATESWSRQALGAAQWELAGSIAELWLDLALVEERIAVLTTQTGRLGRALKIERKRLELGETAGADVVQLELEEARVMAELAAEEGARGRLRAEMARWSADAEVAPRAGDLARLFAVSRGALPTEGHLEEIVEAAPEVVAAREALAMQRSSARLASRKSFGRPAAELEWERISDLAGVPGFDAWGILVHVPLPVGSAGRASRHAALAQERAEESAYEIMRRRSLAGARAQLAAATHAESTLSRLEPVFTGLERTEHALGERFRLGAVNYLVFIDGLARLDDVRLQRAETLHALLSARLALALLGPEERLFPLPDEFRGVEAEVSR